MDLLLWLKLPLLALIPPLHFPCVDLLHWLQLLLLQPLPLLLLRIPCMSLVPPWCLPTAPLHCQTRSCPSRQCSLSIGCSTLLLPPFLPVLLGQCVRACFMLPW